MHFRPSIRIGHRSCLATVFCLSLIGVTAEGAEEHKYLKAFPAASEGMTRFVIELPHKERGEEDAFQVELIVGKEIQTDGVNRARMGGQIIDKPLKGWGFTYYETPKLGPVMTTRIGVPPGTPPVMKFVNIPTRLIRYNSRIPVVVYVPKGAEVRYRIWTASEKTSTAEAK